jgi:dTMP kinase
MEALRGRMIALEGVDGAGKSTATRAVAQRLRAGGLDVRVHDFPVYDEPRFGPLIAAFLRGELRVEGDRAPWLIATLFAGNRAATAGALRAELAGGATLVCDRYHLSNAAYQGAKLPPGASLDDFLAWVLDVELDVLGALRPDASIWLRVPLELRPARGRGDAARAYLEGADEDVHEADAGLQRRVHEAYERLAALGAVVPVDCAPHGALLAPDEVAAAVLAAAAQALDAAGAGSSAGAP